MATGNPTLTFLTEAEDLLLRVEEITLGLTPGVATDEAINQLFRAFHTIKGSGAMFGFDAVAQFTHHVETALDKVRDGIVPVSEEFIKLVLRSRDQINVLLDAAQNESEPDRAACDEIIAALNALAPASSQTSTPPRVSPTTASVKLEPEGPAKTYCIQFRPDPMVMVCGGNPIALLNELRSLGECSAIANIDAVPELEHLQPDNCHLSWNITLNTSRGENSIRDIFIFVEDGSTLRISGEDGEDDTPVQPPPVAPTSVSRAESPNTSPSPAPKAAAPAGPRKPAGREATVRVPSERLDRLVNLIGELVMNQSRLTQVAASVSVPNLSAPVEELDRLVAELRDNVLGIRMMPIGLTFTRFKRLVHDLSRELGKEIDLVTTGEDTEVDKTVLDQLADPIVHLIRNSIDHGIESPGERTRLGKPRRGSISLAAAHIGSNVVITVSDDGRGIDFAAVREKAIERGLIAPGATLSEADARDLILRPGFSTAERVTNVSGRGVGMDVVKRQIDSLGGQLLLCSKKNEGTKITLTLPLTLAIIEGLLVEIGTDQFIIPMAVVTENVEITRAERGRHNGRNAVDVRGDLVPYIRLREDFAIRGPDQDIEKIVIARHGDDRVGLVVDRVLGSHQTVIQPLGKFYRNIELVSGATIMGDGRVAMILDLSGIVRHVKKSHDGELRVCPAAVANPSTNGHL